MKALFLYDIRIFGIQYLSITLFFIIANMIALCMDLDNLFVIARYIIFFSALMYIVLTLFSDVNNESKWHLLQSSMPIRKRDIVNEKFIISFIFTFILIAVGIIVIYLNKEKYFYAEEYGILSDAFELGLSIFTWCAIIFIFTACNVITNSKSMRGGVAFAGLIFYIVVITIAYGLAAAFATQSSGYDVVLNILTIGAAVYLITLVAAYITSRISIKKREYI